jgi:hydroxymethylglutaryl-CoA lyase
MKAPSDITIFEVGPRDGLQNESPGLSVEVKAELIDRLSDSGLPFIEAGSFVSPKYIPQMANSEDVLARIERNNKTAYAALVPNLIGFERALSAKSDIVAIFTAASEVFAQRNTNCSIDENFNRFGPVLERARELNIPVRGYVSCVMGCPYQGDVPAADVAEVAERLLKMGCYEVSLGDTIGIGDPLRTQLLIDAVADRIPIEKIAVHFHDTYGQALANILRAIDKGVTTIDSAVGGLGGCPYADGASGNVATEDVIYMLNGMSLSTGVDLNKIVETAWWISKKLNKNPSSRVAHAMGAGN